MAKPRFKLRLTSDSEGSNVSWEMTPSYLPLFLTTLQPAFCSNQPLSFPSLYPEDTLLNLAAILFLRIPSPFLATSTDYLRLLTSSLHFPSFPLNKDPPFPEILIQSYSKYHLI